MTTMEMTPEQQELEQRRRFAEALMQRSQERLPQGQMAGRIYVGTNPLHYLAQGLKQYAAKKDLQEVGKESKALGEKQNQALIGALRGFTDKMSGKPEQTQQIMGDMGEIDQSMAGLGPVNNFTPAVPADPRGAYAGLIGSGVPQLRQLGVQGMAQLPQLEAARAEKDENRKFRQQESELARQARVEQLNLAHQQRMDAMQAQNASREQMAEAQRQHQIELRQMTGAMAASMRQPRAPVAVMGPDGKPIYVEPDKAIGMTPASKTGENKLPATALKMQQVELDALGTAAGVIADTAALQKQIESGALKLGPMQNLASKGKNVAGLSDENSRNYANFMTSLEKLRNDSLRLNNGVQTEGDAIRAMNELMAGINDPKVVARQLGKINEINRRAVNLRKMSIEGIRQNFGAEPMDFSPYEAMPAATGQPSGLPNADAIEAELRRRRGGK